MKNIHILSTDKPSRLAYVGTHRLCFGEKYYPNTTYCKSKRMYSEKQMLDFAWFLLENVGQFSSDRNAHFEGKYLEMFKKKKL